MSEDIEGPITAEEEQLIQSASGALYKRNVTVRGTADEDRVVAEHDAVMRLRRRNAHVEDVVTSQHTEIARLRTALAAEEARNEALCKRLDAERSGDTIAHCYNPDDWEYTYAWGDRDEVHGHGENLKTGEAMLVFTLLRGPRKWVAEIPLSRDEDGEPTETEFRWFDSEEEAEAALKGPSP